MGIEGIPDSMLACQLLEVRTTPPSPLEYPSSASYGHPDQHINANKVSEQFNKPYKIHEIPTPSSLGPHDILVKVAVASYCHTDGMVSAGIMGTSLPCTASHEGAGTVVAVGSSISSFQKGDRVLCPLMRNNCGACPDCLGPENYTQYCPHNDGACGVNLDGFFAQYAIIDGRGANRLPDRLSFATAAPLACAGCTVWRGVLQAGLTPGEWLCIVGAGGGLGHMGVQFAKALGLQVVGVEAREEGMKLAKSAGADVVVDARAGKEKVAEEVRKVTGGHGADATVNVSDADEAAAVACAVTKMHGLMVQIAQPPEVKIPFVEFVFRDVRVQGSLISSRDESRRMLELVVAHNVHVRKNVFHGLAEIPKMLELVHSGKMAGKGVVVVDEDAIRAEKESGLDMV
ncbi:MAG: hypothetical protein M1819_002297 [Sarea resinae]|nr:MAG: hypothetical protein M1819_002297 [Sarea resinae]